MTTNERLNFIVTMTSKDAVAGFKQLGAETTKAGTSFSTLATKAAGFVAVGAGVAAAGFKAVKAFQDTALSAGKFSDATGLAVQDASRWIEVVGDMGVEAGALQTSLGRLAKASDKTFAQFGIDVARTKTGAMDVNATFMNAIDTLQSMDDPARRAAAATALFGRGWQSVSELLNTSSSRLRASLAAVSDAKVVTPEELAKAKQFRDTLENLRDVAEDLTITIGGKLVDAAQRFQGTLQSIADLSPIDIKINFTRVGGVAADVANYPGQVAALIGAQLGGKSGSGFGGTVRRVVAAGFTGGVSEGLRAVRNWWGDSGDKIGTIIPMSAIQAMTDDVKRRFGLAWAAGPSVTLTPAVDDLQSAFARLSLSQTAAGFAAMTGAAMNAEAAIRGVERGWEKLTGSFSDDNALLDVQDAFDALTDTKFPKTEQGIRDMRRATNDLKLKVADYGKEVLNLPADKVTTLTAQIDAGQFYWVEQQLAILTRNRTVSLSLKGIGADSSFKIGHKDAGKSIAQFGDGGMVGGGPIGAPVLIGAHVGETVLPTHKRGGGAGGGPVNITVNVTAGMGADGYGIARAVREALHQSVQTDGPLPAYLVGN